MTDPLELGPAAEALGVAPSTLRRWTRQGAPVARRGRRGRGGAARYDVDAIRRWQRLQRSDVAIAAVDLPRVIADAVCRLYVDLEGPHKRPCAGFAAGVWYAVSVAALDHLRAHAADVGDIEALPENIRRLRAIWAESVR